MSDRPESVVEPGRVDDAVVGAALETSQTIAKESYETYTRLKSTAPDSAVDYLIRALELGSDDAYADLKQTSWAESPRDVRAASLLNQTQSSLLRLGYAYWLGVGQVQNEANAFYIFTHLTQANRRCSMAQFALAIISQKGSEAHRNDEQSAFWYKQSAGQGHILSQFSLGVLYATGRGVDQNDQQAAYWFEKSAVQGNCDAQFNLGVLYATGRGVDQSDQQAAYWFEKSAVQGKSNAQCNLGLMYATGRGVDQSDELEAYWFEKAALQGNSSAQFNLGLMYVTGRGVEQSYQQAAYWYEQAAAQGNSTAQFYLGALYSTGQGVDQSDQQAAYWFEKSALQGNCDAQFNLGVRYAMGQGVDQNDQQAVYWYEKAALQGKSNAQYNLGVMYSKGRGVAQSDEQAVYWCEKSAAQNDKDAQYNLGIRYAIGQGVVQSDEQAGYWLEKAAAQGHCDAQYNLGVMYAAGRGVAQSDEQATYWYEKSAAQGDRDAQYNLGIRYATGQGIAQSDIQAVYWYKKAADQGMAEAQFELSGRYASGLGVPQSDVNASRMLHLAAEQSYELAINTLQEEKNIYTKMHQALLQLNSDRALELTGQYPELVEELLWALTRLQKNTTSKQAVTELIKRILEQVPWSTEYFSQFLQLADQLMKRLPEDAIAIQLLVFRRRLDDLQQPVSSTLDVRCTLSAIELLCDTWTEGRERCVSESLPDLYEQTALKLSTLLHHLIELDDSVVLEPSLSKLCALILIKHYYGEDFEVAFTTHVSPMPLVTFARLVSENPGLSYQSLNAELGIELIRTVVYRPAILLVEQLSIYFSHQKHHAYHELITVLKRAFLANKSDDVAREVLAVVSRIAAGLLSQGRMAKLRANYGEVYPLLATLSRQRYTDSLNWLKTRVGSPQHHEGSLSAYPGRFSVLAQPASPIKARKGRPDTGDASMQPTTK